MISGEQIQELCDIYCGLKEDFEYNPRIRKQVKKHMDLSTVITSWNNPRKIFCYTHRLDHFMEILPSIQNNFILISHNSDGNVTEKYLPLLQHPKLLFWHAQNVLLSHPKLGCIPIGLANSMWPHGNQEIMLDVITRKNEKINSVFFNFSGHTNPSERMYCYDALKDKLVWQPTVRFQEYLETMSTYKYAICPPGNGIDCHRIWECIYLGVIPILLRSPCTEKIHTKFPSVLLDRWEDFNEELIRAYKSPMYDVSFEQLKGCIEQCIKFF